MKTRTVRKPVTLNASPWRSRQLPRYPVDLLIRVALPATPKPIVLRARTVDLSTGGINISLPHEILENSPAMVGLRLPGPSPAASAEPVFWFRARLRHRTGFRCGFQFLDLTSEQRLLLRRLCLALSQ
jgi:hypothetical protein